jgi:hypothetical protein
MRCTWNHAFACLQGPAFSLWINARPIGLGRAEVHSPVRAEVVEPFSPLRQGVDAEAGRLQGSQQRLLTAVSAGRSGSICQFPCVCVSEVWLARGGAESTLPPLPTVRDLGIRRPRMRLPLHWCSRREAFLRRFSIGNVLFPAQQPGQRNGWHHITHREERLARFQKVSQNSKRSHVEVKHLATCDWEQSPVLLAVGLDIVGTSDQDWVRLERLVLGRLSDFAETVGRACVHFAILVTVMLRSRVGGLAIPR